MVQSAGYAAFFFTQQNTTSDNNSRGQTIELFVINDRIEELRVDMGLTVETIDNLKFGGQVFEMEMEYLASASATWEFMDKEVVEDAIWTGGSIIPGVGEVGDFRVLVGDDSTTTERVVAGGSLLLSAVTLGFSPNFGSAAKGATKVAAKNADEAVDGVRAATKGASDATESIADQASCLTRTLYGSHEYVVRDPQKVAETAEELVKYYNRYNPRPKVKWVDDHLLKGAAEIDSITGEIRLGKA